MRLSVKAFAITSAILVSGSVFVTALIHRFYPTYGTAYLELASSLYPGYHVGGMKAGLVGTAYALVDGAVCGALFAWIYNLVVGATANVTADTH